MCFSPSDPVSCHSGTEYEKLIQLIQPEKMRLKYLIIDCEDIFFECRCDKNYVSMADLLWSAIEKVEHLNIIKFVPPCGGRDAKCIRPEAAASPSFMCASQDLPQ